MKVLQVLILYSISICMILLLDFIWLGVVQRENWKKTVKAVQKEDIQIRYKYSIMAYLLLAYIPVHISIWNSEYSYGYSFLNGLLIGLFVYGIFNLTNLSIFKNYNIKTALYDTLWGMFLIMIISMILNFIGQKTIYI